MHTICLVEDELDLSKLIKMYLEKANYNVVTFDKGEDAINYIGNKVDIWILDIMLKDDVNGYDIIKEIRKENELVPVIFTSARDQDLDKILGLELGSDDYITKPYSPKELVLRVNNIIKRVYGTNDQNIIKYNNYVINLDKRKVTLDDKELRLTTLEFDLLVYLLSNKGKQLSREEILEKVWQEDYFGSDRAVDDLIRRLRKKMNINVQSIYGYGYRLDE